MSPATRSSGRICWHRPSEGPHGETQYVSSLALTLDDSDRYVLPAEPASRGPRRIGRPKAAAAEGKEAVMAEAVDTPTAILASAAAAAARAIRSTTSRTVPSATRSASRSARSTATSRRDRTCSRASRAGSSQTEFPLPPFVTIAEFQRRGARAVPWPSTRRRPTRSCALARHPSRRRSDAGAHLLHACDRGDARRDAAVRSTSGISAGSRHPCATSRRRSSGRACGRAST